MTADDERIELILTGIVPIRVKTPDACDDCLYRRLEWRDGG